LTDFNRTASLVVGPSGTGIKVSGLKIMFNIRKTSGNKDINTCDVSVYNLSRKTRDKMDENFTPTTKNKLFLNAGYTRGEGEKLIFLGDVTELNHEEERPDVITRIKAEDGQKNLSEVKANFSFSKNTSAKAVLVNFLKTFPAKNNLNDVSFKDVILKHGFSFSGLAKYGVTKITELLELDWSVQNDEIRVIPKDSNDGTLVTSIGPTSGLIRSPIRISNKTEQAKGESKELKQGWKVRSLLKPDVIPGNRLVIDSKLVPKDSIFTVKSIVHVGDTHGEDWTSEIEVTE